MAWPVQGAANDPEGRNKGWRDTETVGQSRWGREGPAGQTVDFGLILKTSKPRGSFVSLDTYRDCWPLFAEYRGRKTIWKVIELTQASNDLPHNFTYLTH